jgi:hypothetical protein
MKQRVGNVWFTQDARNNLYGMGNVSRPLNSSAATFTDREVYVSHCQLDPRAEAPNFGAKWIN